MGLRIIKRLGVFILTIAMAVVLTGCSINLIDPDGFLNKSPNEEVNIVYYYLDKFYYEDLPLNLKKIKTVEELLSYADPYTLLYTEGSMSIEREESYYGLGITIANHDLGLLVTEINYFIDYDQYIYVGDIITTVNDVDLIDMETMDEKTELLKGEYLDPINLAVLRLGEIVEVELEIIEIPYKSINYQKINDIGYIQITRFGKNTALYFKQALEELEDEGIESLIIDVRNNGGGYLSEALDILKMFIVDEEPFLYTYYVKEDLKEPYYSLEELEKERDYEILFLVNSGSASASEVVAGTFQKYGYELFGERTYGKDLYQAGIPLYEYHKDIFPKGTRLNLTYGYWYLNDESRVVGGIEPDIYFTEAGIKTLLYPALLKEYSKGESNEYIYVYQYLISLSVEGTYIPKYFDENFELMVLEYQSLNDLEQTGKLDVPTMMLLIDLYRSMRKDQATDNLLTEAIYYMENKVNGN